MKKKKNPQKYVRHNVSTPGYILTPFFMDIDTILSLWAKPVINSMFGGHYISFNSIFINLRFDSHFLSKGTWITKNIF